MQSDVVTVAPATSLKEVAELLAAYRISGVPVCSEDETVLGVVSEQDILWKEVGAEENRSLVHRVLGYAYGLNRRTDAQTARDAMSAPAVTIGARESVAAAAQLMICRRVNRLPVISDGRLVGIVTRADLVRAFTRTDAEIADEIANDILKTTFWVDPGSHSLYVHSGEVTIAGEVENRTTANLVESYIHGVPGVIRLTSKLTWRIDDTARRVAASADHLPRRL